MTDSGKKAGDFLTSHQTIKQDGVTGATVNRFGTCSTAAGTAAKTVSITTGTFALEAGARVSVKFSNANTAGTPTLNVNSKGAKNIYHKGSQITTGDNKALLAGVCDFIYDGTQWHLVGNYIDNNTTYVSKGSATKGVYFDSNGAAQEMTYSVSKSVPSDAVFTDTTYESKSASSGGTAVSLCTTGEKYTWNNKGDKQTSKGSATKGVYFDANGAAQAMTYSVSKSVPSDAVFTDNGHTIKDKSGTSMTQRANLQFNGMDVTDDSTNGKTIINSLPYVRPNLLSGTKNFSGSWVNGSAWTTGSNYSDPYGNVLTVKERTLSWSALGKTVTVKPGVYTFSCYVKGTVDASSKNYLFLNKSDDTVTNLAGITKPFDGNYLVTGSYPIKTYNTEFFRYSYTFIVTAEQEIKAAVGSSDTNNVISVAGFKLEEGDYPTPWCE